MFVIELSQEIKTYRNIKIYIINKIKLISLYEDKSIN